MGKLHVSSPFDLKNVFHSTTEREDFTSFVDFLVNLEHYAYLNNDNFQKAKKNVHGALYTPIM